MKKSVDNKMIIIRVLRGPWYVWTVFKGGASKFSGRQIINQQPIQNNGQHYEVTNTWSYCHPRRNETRKTAIDRKQRKLL